MKKKTGYSIYSKKATAKTKTNPLKEIYPKLPNKKYDVVYADPPWDYGGKVQYDNTSIEELNIGFKKDIFISSASFKYPTLTLKELKKLPVKSISADDSLLFMWATGPQFANAIKLGVAWGFEYKTVAFVWDKMMHNPGHYTLSQAEFCLLFKRGRIPTPRGARNIKQLVQEKRRKHSEKPLEVANRINEMFPKQEKIELFARVNLVGWDNWGLEVPESKINIFSQKDKKTRQRTFDFL